MIEIVKDDLEKIFKRAGKIKPKYNLTAEQMDELIENEILGKPYIPREEP